MEVFRGVADECKDLGHGVVKDCHEYLSVFELTSLLGQHPETSDIKCLSLINILKLTSSKKDIYKIKGAIGPCLQLVAPQAGVVSVKDMLWWINVKSTHTIYVVFCTI